MSTVQRLAPPRKGASKQTARSLSEELDGI